MKKKKKSNFSSFPTENLFNPQQENIACLSQNVLVIKLLQIVPIH